MRTMLLAFLVLLNLTFPSPLAAKTGIIFLPPDYPESKSELTDAIGGAILALEPKDHLLVYAARPVRQLADVTIPESPNAVNRAWVKHKLAEQAAPVISYIDALPSASATEPPGNLMIPGLIDELARNILPTLADKRADILLLGSLIYYDAQDDRWSMTERFVPSDGMLKGDPAKQPYAITSYEGRLDGSTIHFCTPQGYAQYVSLEHEAAVKRWWSIWTTAQSGRVGTFSNDLSTCFRRFLLGEASGQPTYHPTTDAKAEMTRVRLPMPSVLPKSTAEPGEVDPGFGTIG